MAISVVLVISSPEYAEILQDKAFVKGIKSFKLQLGVSILYCKSTKNQGGTAAPMQAVL